MKKTTNRREFLKRMSAAALSAPFLTGCAMSQITANDDLQIIKKNADLSGASWSGAKDAPGNITSSANFLSRKESGESLVVTGTVFMPDGKTPAPNVLIYAYHTDTKGIYGTEGEHKHGRFRGWMLTDKKGRYKITTIKPGHYPTGQTPAHIHYTLTGKSFREDWVDSVLFKGDEKISDGIRRGLSGKGGFDPIISITKKADGVLHGIRNIKLEESWL